MVEYFFERVFKKIEEYWVNTKSSHIPISFRDKNTKKSKRAHIHIKEISHAILPSPCERLGRERWWLRLRVLRIIKPNMCMLLFFI
jgi:hypothetical protein